MQARGRGFESPRLHQPLLAAGHTHGQRLFTAAGRSAAQRSRRIEDYRERCPAGVRTRTSGFQWGFQGCGAEPGGGTLPGGGRLTDAPRAFFVRRETVACVLEGRHESEVLGVKSVSVGTILGVASLVGVGVLYLKVEQLEERMLPTEHGRAPVHREAAWEAPPVSSDESTLADEDPGGSMGIAAGTARSGGRRERKSVEDRLDRLEERVRVRGEAESRRAMPGRMIRMPRVVTGVDDLSRSLKLTPSQSDRVKETVRHAKQRIEDLLRVPDASGRSPFERRQAQRERMRKAARDGNPGDVLRFVLGSQGRLGEPIPGRGTTYGEEIDLVKRETRAEIEALLDQDQREKFEETNIDPMLGDGGSSVVSVISIGELAPPGEDSGADGEPTTDLDEE